MKSHKAWKFTIQPTCASFHTEFWLNTTPKHSEMLQACFPMQAKSAVLYQLPSFNTKGNHVNEDTAFLQQQAAPQENAKFILQLTYWISDYFI